MMNDRREPASRYAIGELAELAGVSRRTVRYYVQRGLLQTPTGLGRGRHYTQRHLDTLIRIRELQEAGRPLAEIAAELGRDNGGAEVPAEPAVPVEPPRSSPRYSRWTRIEILDGVELHLRDRRLGSRQIQALGEAFTKIIQQGGNR